MSEQGRERVATDAPASAGDGARDAPGPRGTARATPRGSFHVLLGAIFVPLLSLPFEWASAVRWLRRARDDEGRRWARRILALAVVDTVAVATVVMLGMLMLWAPEAASEPATAAPRPRVVIGVRHDPGYGGPGIRIQGLLPEGPAAVAGLEVGDVIVRVAGEEISTPAALQTVLAKQEPGVRIAVEVMRGGSTSTLDVTPTWATDSRRARLGVLDPVRRREPRACVSSADLRAIVPLAAVCAAIAVLAALLARRGSAAAARGVSFTGLSLIASVLAANAVAVGACAVLGGFTTAGAAFAVWGSSLALCGTALLGRRSLRRSHAREPAPTRTWRSAVKLGIWYLVTGSPRVAVFSLAAMLLAGTTDAGSGPVESLVDVAGAAPSPALLLLAIPTVLIGPIGEEVAFRGLLQPALGSWLRPAGAVAVTSVLFAVPHWYYGFKLPVIVLLAVVLGWARIASGGLRAPILLHALVNAATFVTISIGALQRG